MGHFKGKFKLDFVSLNVLLIYLVLADCWFSELKFLRGMKRVGLFPSQKKQRTGPPALAHLPREAARGRAAATKRGGRCGR